MVRILCVGDVHTTKEELPDCQALLDFVLATANSTKPDFVLFLGDQHHNHSIVHVEVLDFWKRNLSKFEAARISVAMLVGNHDRPHNVNLKADSLPYQKEHCLVIDKPVIKEQFALVPWCPTHKEFVDAVGDYKGVVLCHCTFDGAYYENGFYAPDGIPMDLLPGPSLFISGHIHTPSSFDRVRYIGAPRWRTASDVNIDRNIVLYEIDEKVKATPFSTRGVCRALYHFDDCEGQEVKEPAVIQPSKVTVNVYGSLEYVKIKSSIWTDKGYLVATFPTRQSKQTVRESDGIPQAISKHVNLFQPRFGTPTEVLTKMVSERVKI